MSIKIDNIDFPVEWVKNSFTISAEIMNGAKSGRKQNRNMFLQYLGTFYNFSGTIVKQHRCTDEQWDNLFSRLSNYENVHNVEVPFLQGYMKCDIYISSVSRNYINDKLKWKRTIDVQFVPILSQARASDFTDTGTIDSLNTNDTDLSEIVKLSDYIAPSSASALNGNNYVRGYYWSSSSARPPWNL